MTVSRCGLFGHAARNPYRICRLSASRSRICSMVVTFLGWTPVVQKAIQQQAQERLHRYTHGLRNPRDTQRAASK